MLTREHYYELIDNLHLAVQHEFGSVRQYCIQHKMNRSNLVAVFNRRQDISVGLFMKIMCDLKRLDMKRPNQNWNMSLMQYLEINHSNVMIAIMQLYTNA